jgi:hypothetical protein
MEVPPASPQSLPVTELWEADVYLDLLGYEVAVIMRDSDQAMVQETAVFGLSRLKPSPTRP